MNSLPPILIHCTVSSLSDQLVFNGQITSLYFWYLDGMMIVYLKSEKNRESKFANKTKAQALCVAFRSCRSK